MNEVATSSVSFGSTSRTPLAMDPTHAFYLHSSDSSGMNLVNTPFDGRGYQGWKRSMLIALSAKNKLVLPQVMMLHQILNLQICNLGADVMAW